HAGKDRRLAFIEVRLGIGLQRDVGNVARRTLEGERQVVGEGDGRYAGEQSGQPCEEAGAEVAAHANRLTALDVVLRLEVAAREVVGAGEGNEGELLLLPQRVERVAHHRVEAPVCVQRHGAVGIIRVGALDRERGSRGVVEVAAGGHQQVVAVVAAAQEHQQEARRVRGRGEQAAGERQRGSGGCAGGGKQEFATVHGGYLDDGLAPPA